MCVCVCVCVCVQVSAIEVVEVSEKKGEEKEREMRQRPLVRGSCARERGSQTSFERFLRSLPRADPVDRTVDWVLAQPDSSEVSC